MTKPYSKLDSTRHAKRDQKENPKRKPIPKISEKKKAELENRKTWTVEQFKKSQKEGKKEKKQERKVEKKKSALLSEIKKDLDVIYSCVVRMEPCNSEGITCCVTCNKYQHWSKLQNGHFIKRSIAPSLVFNRANTEPQCPRCNVLLEGNRVPYMRYMNEKYGVEFIYMLEMAGQQKSNNGAFEYQIMLQEYIEKFLIQCTRLNHTPTKIQQKIVDKWRLI